MLSDIGLQDRSKGKVLNCVSPSKWNIKKETNVDMDLTGSPLKDDCQVDAIGDMSLDLNLISVNPWKPEEEYHKGISVDKARAIITNQEFQKCSTAGEVAGSVWFLCSGTDLAKTLFLQYEFAHNFKSRGIINYIGVLPAHAISSQYLLQQHFAVVGKDARVETQIENTYNIKLNISIKCSWTTVSAAPSLIDLRTCDVVLRQTLVLSDSNPSTADFINQLRILMQIRDEIISYKLSENSNFAKEPVYDCGM